MPPMPPDGLSGGFFVEKPLAGQINWQKPAYVCRENRLYSLNPEKGRIRMKGLRKIAAVFCCVCLLVGFSGMGVLADGDGAASHEPPGLITDESDGESAVSLIQEGEEEWIATGTVPTDAGALEVGGKGAVLMELSSGQVLFEKNPHEKLPIASVTKIMTLLLVMEALDSGQITLEEPVSCSATAASMGGSQIWLEEGEVMSVSELIKAAAVVSANDACAALAEHISGSIESFVAKMNERAAELGMADTQFLDCSGLSDDAYSSAYDVALMSRELMKHKKITEYTTIWMDSLRDGKSQLVNTNKLVRHYKGATGLKTGTTQKAGHCLAATAERDGMGLVAVTLGCATTDERFGGARKMLDFGFANYSIYTPPIDQEQLQPVPVLHGVEPSVAPQAAAPSPILLKKGQEKGVSVIVELAENLEAPVVEGQAIGSISVKLDDQEIASYPITASSGVPPITFGVAFRWLLQALFG